MGVGDAKREELNRLDCKTTDAQFKTTVREGLNCSPFDAAPAEAGGRHAAAAMATAPIRVWLGAEPRFK